MLEEFLQETQENRGYYEGLGIEGNASKILLENQ
jgi:hypothetical protein